MAIKKTTSVIPFKASSLRPGPKQFVEDDEMLERIYDLVYNKGCEKDISLYTALGMSEWTWYNLKRNPDSKISQVISQAREDIVTQCKDVVITAARNKKSKNNFRAATYLMDRDDKLNGRNVVTVNHTGEVQLKDVLDLPLDALDEQLNVVLTVEKNNE